MLWFSAAALAQAQDDVIPLIVELLGDKDKEVRSLALEQVRTEVPGEAATLKFAELLPTLPPETQAGLLSALAARGDAAAAPAVRKMLAESEQPEVRIAATRAISFLGSQEDVPALIKLLASGDDAQQKAARAGLVRLAGEPVSRAVIAQMKAAEAPLRVTLIEILTQRRDGADELAAQALGKEPQVRRAAMQALGQIGSLAQLPRMLQAVLVAEPGDERNAAERAVAAVAQRAGDAKDPSVAIVAAIADFDADEQRALLPLLGRIGGAEALKLIEAAYDDDDPQRHAAGMAALCNWPKGSIAPQLLEIARTAKRPDDRNKARKTLIRIAPLPDERSDERRLDLLRTTMAMCSDEAERKQLLERAKAIRLVETLRFVVPYLDDPQFAQQACVTVVELAHHSGLREPHKDEFHRALDQVIAISQDPVVVDRAQRYKKGQTWARPKAPAS
jgi:HEAT repeat protein